MQRHGLVEVGGDAQDRGHWWNLLEEAKAHSGL